MATYNDLTQEQKDAVQALNRLARACAGEIARLSNHCRAVANDYSGNVETMLNSITNANDLIPDSSGLAGAIQLSRGDLQTLIGYCMTLSDPADGASGSYNTNYHRGLYAKAAGPNNLIG